MEIEQLEKVIKDLFGGLTESLQIANLCREHQIQGFVGNVLSCPMVKLVRGQVNFPVAFTLGRKFGTGRWVVVFVDKQISIPSPLVCDKFADEFDLKRFPDLIAFGEYDGKAKDQSVASGATAGFSQPMVSGSMGSASQEEVSTEHRQDRDGEASRIEQANNGTTDSDIKGDAT